MMSKNGATRFILAFGAGALLLLVVAGALSGVAPEKKLRMGTDQGNMNKAAAPTVAAAPTAAANGVRRRRPLVMAHRGGAGLWPENTLHAFTESVALGVDVLETDLHATADGALVLIHDATVERTTDGAGAVNALTLAALKKLDAGYRWTNDGGRTFPFRGKGLTIATLGEVTAAFPGVRLNIDIKAAHPALVVNFCRELRASRAAERVNVASFNWQTLAEFRRECPEVSTSASFDEVLALLADAKESAQPQQQEKGSATAFERVNLRAVQVPESAGGRQLLTAELVAAAHRRGLEVHIWTVNEEAAMRRLIKLGVDGIITDRPDKLIELLKTGAER